MSKIIDRLVFKNSKGETAIIFHFDGISGKVTSEEIKKEVLNEFPSKVRVYYWYDDVYGSLNDRNVFTKFNYEFELNGLTSRNSGCFSISENTPEFFARIYEPSKVTMLDLRNNPDLNWIKPRQGCDGGVVTIS